MLIEPVAYVHNEILVHEGVSELRGDESRIEVLPKYKELLHRIEEHGELDIIFRFHQVHEWHSKVHPKGDPSNPEYGTFATRSPYRPNFLGVTRVMLLRKEGLDLIVTDLDAFDGTPVIDIKPAEWPPAEINGKINNTD